MAIDGFVCEVANRAGVLKFLKNIAMEDCLAVNL